MIPLPSRRVLLLASVSLLALAAAPAFAQTAPFARRGAGAADPASAAARALQAQTQETARAAQYAQSSTQVFARAAQTQAAMASLQAAARAAAQAAPAPGVPDGLQPGGLVPQLDPASWRGAAAPVQAAGSTPGRTAVTVRQTEQRAILTWQSFNVGRETDLRFDQSAGGSRAREWAVLNRIEDPNAQPSRILGSIVAEGQVYVINRNGVVFGGASQVNVSTLIASALDLGGWTDTLAARNQRFVNGLLTQPTSAGNVAPSLSLDQPALLRDEAGQPRRIAVEVEAGARITLREEGSAILAAPLVVNAGTITAPAGQVILAAGAGLRLDTPTASSFGPRIGLEVEALRSGDNADTPLLDGYGFRVSNAGLISAPRGNVTMAGLSVTNAPGAMLAATTGSNRPGSITLTARDVGGTEDIFTTGDPGNVPGYRFGDLTLGAGSLVQVLAETGADQVVFNTATAPFEQSRLALNAATIRVAEGAIVRAPAASMRIAGDLPARLFPRNATSAGRLQVLLMEPGATLDLSGLKDLTAPVARNMVEVQTFRNELRDAPISREGFLYSYAQGGGRVTIDTRVGSRIVDWAPTANGIPVSVAERQGVGGSIEIAAERVIMMAGSRIDTSGGLLAWQGGARPSETRLLGADGRVYGIGTAAPDTQFVGIAGDFVATQSRWGIQQTYRAPIQAQRPVAEAGYVDGFDAGSVTIAGRFYGDGVIQGGAFVGSRQAAAGRANDGSPITTADLPGGGTLAFLGFRPIDSNGSAVPRSSGIGGLVNPTIVTAIEAPLPIDLPARLLPDQDAIIDRRWRLDGDPLPAERFDTLLSTRDVLGRGWSNIRIQADGRVTLGAEVTLTLPAGGRLAIDAWSADIAGRIHAPAGAITITANAGDRVAGLAETLAAPALFGLSDGAPRSALDGAIRLAPGAVLSVAGRWVNDALATTEGSAPEGPAFLNGGTITLQTRFLPLLPDEIPPLPTGATVDPDAVAVAGRDILLGAGALLDVSAGGRIAAPGRAPTGARGGTLTVGTYASLAASPTGAPASAGAISAGLVGFYIAGRFASPIDQGAVLRGFGTGSAGGGAANGLGGTLALSAPWLVLGRPTLTTEAAQGAISIDAARHAEAGFSDLRFTAPIGGRMPFKDLPAGRITVARGADIAPIASTRAFAPDAAAAASGAAPDRWSQATRLAQSDRSPVRLTLAAGNELDLGSAATRLAADPGAARTDSAALISLSAPRPIRIRGTLEAPAGAIQVTGTGPIGPYGLESGDLTLREAVGTEFQLSHALWVAATARLLTPGLADSVPAANGLRAGGVRPGGSVTLQENRGYLVVEAGALIDVSGAAGVTAIPGDGLTPDQAGTLALASDAGSITLGGARGLFLDGTLRGAPGGATARGATLTIRAPTPVTLLEAGFSQPTPRISVPANLAGFTGIVLQQAAGTLPEGLTFGQVIDSTLVRTGPISWSGGARTGRAVLAADQLAGSGIDRLYLASGTAAVRVEGDVTLSVARALQIEAPAIELAPAPGALPGAIAPSARLAAPYILLNGSNLAPEAPTSAAAGTLTLAGDWIDLVGGVALRGAARNVLIANDDLRLTGSLPDSTDIGFGRVRGTLNAQGNLLLRAGQVYPSTGTAFTIATSDVADAPDRTLRIEPAGAERPVAPLSAGGSLLLTSAIIEQAGVLRAPQGALTLRATRRVSLLAGGLTSVSADGQLVPYGELVSDLGPLGFELYPGTFGPLAGLTGGLAGPPARAIDLDAPGVRIAEGATLDVSGGGELLGFRFVSGPGGSRNVLARAQVNAGPGGDAVIADYQFADRRDVFAILPGAQPKASPVSAYIVDSGTSLGRGDVTALQPTTGLNAYGQQVTGLMPTIGDQIRLDAGIPGLPAGTYTLLPGRYALLPGAFRVVLAPGQAGPALAQPTADPVQRADGSWLLSGRRTVAGTDLLEDRPRRVEIADAASWSRYSAITTTKASDFYSARAARTGQTLPQLPEDAGRLSLNAASGLQLRGTTLFGRGPEGRGGEVEISAGRIAITPDGAAYAGDGGPYLPISAAALSALGAESVTIGGRRRTEAEGQRLEITAAAVVVAEGAVLRAPELLLLARRPTGAQARAGDGLRVEDGAALIATGGGAAPGGDLLLGRVAAGETAALPGGGALLRLAAGDALAVRRSNLDPADASGITIGAAARLEGGSIMMDVTGPGIFAPDVSFNAQIIDLTASTILLGDAPGAADGRALGLRQGILAGLGGLDRLALRSRAAIDVHGAVALAADTIVLDAAALRGFDSASLTITADTLAALRNGAGAAMVAAVPTATGALRVEAGQEIRIGGGDLAVSGFGATRLATAGALTIAGRGALDLPLDLAVAASLITAAPGADVSLRAAGAVTLGGSAGPAPTLPDAGLGARLVVAAGGPLTIDTRIALPAGTLDLTALSGDLLLGANAALDARGAVRGLFDVTAHAPGGSVTLRATTGALRATAGASIDVSAATPGLATGSEAGDIALVAQAGAVDIGALSLLGRAGPGLPGGGFLLDTGGAVDLPTLAAALDAGGFHGRRVVHSRQGDLTLGAGSVFRAQEIGLTADGGSLLLGGLLDASGPRGGAVALFARDKVELTAGTRIDARGLAAGRAGGTVEIGTRLGALLLDGATIAVDGQDPMRGSLVRLRLPLGALPDSALGLTVTGARRVELEPVVALPTSALANRIALNDAFTALVPQGLRAVHLAGRPDHWRVTPGFEATAPAELILPRALDFATLRTDEGDPGVLTLRVAGDLEILGGLSDGFNGLASTAPQRSDRSWSFRLVAGAELGSANPLATVDSTRLADGRGSVLVGAPWTFDATLFQAEASGSPVTTPVMVRTGTGSIEVAAALDLRLRDPDAVIYTAGRPIADPTLVTGTGPDGSTATGHFFLPVPSTYAAFRGARYDSATDPAVPGTNTDLPPSYLVEGGDVRLLAGRDIRATVIDAGGNNAGQVASAWQSRQGAVDAATGEFIYRPAIIETWVPLESELVQQPVAERTTQTSWWVNISRFAQNIGLLGGGDATVRAGRDLQASVSIPTTGRVGGGLAASYDFAYTPTAAGTPPTIQTGATPRGTGPAVLSVDGGGDMMVKVGRDIGPASQFLVGRGEATIRAGGSLTAQDIGTIDRQFGTDAAQGTVGTVLALGDARYSVVAGGSIAATIYDPMRAPVNRAQAISDAWGFGGSRAVGSFSSYGADSAVALVALGGDVKLLGANGSGDPLGAVTTLRVAPRRVSTSGTLLYRDLVLEGLFGDSDNAFIDSAVQTGRQDLPPNLAITALSGDLDFQRTGPIDEGRTIELSIAPGARGQLALLAAGSIRQPTVTLADPAPGAISTPLRPAYDANAPFSEERAGLDNRRLRRSDDPVAPPAAPSRGEDPDRALIYAAGGSITRPVIDVAKRIGLRSAGDITDLTATVQHVTPGDVSFFWAGRDFGTVADASLAGAAFGNAIELRGPGRLQVIAGRDIAAVRRASNVANPALGVQPADNGIRTTGNAANTLYPEGGGAIDLLFGIDSPAGVDPQRFLDRVLGAGNTEHPYRVELTGTANGSVTWVVQPDAPTRTDAPTLARIAALPLAERLALSVDLLMRELAATGADPRSSLDATPSGAYARGYSAVQALFPDSPGWNAPARELLGAPRYAGNLNLQSSYVRTEQGGDVNVLGPGGDFFLGAISSVVDPYPDRIGLLTLDYGSINIFAFGDVLAGQSRVVTADGGDILIWSSSADINAGLGSKTARFVPPFQVTYLADGTRVPDRAGLITGSGISAYAPFTSPEAVPALLVPPTTETQAAAQADERRRRTAPAITLVAPIGTVDAGDAGISSAAGNITVAALAVANAANISAGGGTSGVPVVAAPNVGAAVSAAASAGAAAGAASDAARQATQAGPGPQAAPQPAVISVEILGFGGSERDAEAIARPS
jgi:filamentous hemagglutinin family protein